MSTKTDFLESWSRLAESDLAAINVVFANQQLRAVCPEMAAYLGARLLAEVAHRQEMRTVPIHGLPWDEGILDNGKLSQCYFASLGIKRAAIHTERLVEWADLMVQSVCVEMARRLTESQQAAEQAIREEN
jgi:hypothetical protein